VDRVIITGDAIVGDLTTRQAFRTVAPPQAGRQFIETLRVHGVDIYARDFGASSWLEHVISWIPFGVLILVAFSLRRRALRRAAPVWNEEQRRELKTSILQRLAGGEHEVSEHDIVSAIVETPLPAAKVVGEVRDVLYEMVVDGGLDLSRNKAFRVASSSFTNEASR
jgi:hypothetical protein